MTKPTNRYARPAEQFHWLVSGITWHPRKPDLFTGIAEISQRGQTITLTADMLDASPWIAKYLGDDEAQIQKWGEVRIRPGAFPEGVPTWTPGSVEEHEAYQAARRDAWAQPTAQARAAALARLRETFGAATAVTSRTLNAATTSPEIRAAEEQQRAAAGGVRHASSYAPVRREA